MTTYTGKIVFVRVWAGAAAVRINDDRVIDWRARGVRTTTRKMSGKKTATEMGLLVIGFNNSAARISRRENSRPLCRARVIGKRLFGRATHHRGRTTDYARAASNGQFFVGPDTRHIIQNKQQQTLNFFFIKASKVSIIIKKQQRLRAAVSILYTGTGWSL